MNFVDIPVEDIYEIFFDKLEPLYDNNDVCYSEGLIYVVVHTIYGAKLDIPQTDIKFEEINQLLESKCDLNIQKYLNQIIYKKQ